jgi:short-subunit dehydrogenase
MKIAGHTALVTGATGGIGQAIARHLHDAGAQLILHGRRVDVLEPLAEELGAQTLPADLSDPAEVDRLVTESGDVDILVANAALPGSGWLNSYSIEEIDRVITVNLRAPIVMSRLMAESMKERGAGHIVFISSLAGKAASPRSSLYSATKFGLRGFALGLRADLHGTGIGVSAVYPGFIRDAGMFAESGAVLPRGVGSSTPDEVAEAVVRAIERDIGEVDVAPLGMRAAATFAGVAPGLAGKVTRRVGGAKLAENLAEGQKSKR